MIITHFPDILSVLPKVYDREVNDFLVPKIIDKKVHYTYLESGKELLFEEFGDTDRFVSLRNTTVKDKNGIYIYEFDRIFDKSEQVGDMPAILIFLYNEEKQKFEVHYYGIDYEDSSMGDIVHEGWIGVEDMDMFNFSNDEVIDNYFKKCQDMIEFESQIN